MPGFLKHATFCPDQHTAFFRWAPAAIGKGMQRQYLITLYRLDRL